MKIPAADLKGRAGDQLGKGNFAVVHDLPGYALPDAQFPLVLKKYKRETLPVSATSLDSIASVRDGLDPKSKQRLDEFTTWPVRIVTQTEDRAQAFGILMRRLPKEAFFDFKGLRDTKRKARELQFAIQDDHFVRSIGLRPLTMVERLELLSELAYGLARLHKLGVVYGDLSLKNVIYLHNPTRVILVDCDSMLCEGTVSPFRRQPHTPGFIPPESARAHVELRARQRTHAPAHQLDILRDTWARQNKKTDVYKFALTVVRVLDYGANRGDNCDPTTALRHLPKKELRDTLAESLSDNPADRPQMRDWYYAFTGKKNTASTTAPSPAHKHNTTPASTTPSWARGWKQRPDGSWVRAEHT